MDPELIALYETLIRHAVKQAVDAVTAIVGTAEISVVDYAYDVATGVITITFQAPQKELEI